MSGCLFFSNPKQYYLHSRSSLSYTGVYQADDLFDWHISQPQAFTFRFEDLYVFYLQLFNVVALYSCSFVWLTLLQDQLAHQSAKTQPSLTFLGVAGRWLDHALWCFVYSHLALLFVGLRVLGRVSIELFSWVL
jgi:hypothetical protein